MTVLALPPRVDLSHVGELTAQLRAAQGAPLTLDAGAVTHFGGLGLQVLLASARSWRARALPLSISPRSEAFDEALAIFGVELSDVQSEEAA